MKLINKLTNETVIKKIKKYKCKLVQLLSVCFW